MNMIEVHVCIECHNDFLPFVQLIDVNTKLKYGIDNKDISLHIFLTLLNLQDLNRTLVNFSSSISFSFLFCMVNISTSWYINLNLGHAI